MTAFIAVFTTLCALAFGWCLWFAIEEREWDRLIPRLLITSIPAVWGIWLLI